MHHEDFEAGFEACQRAVSPAEQRQLNAAAKEFSVGAVLASMQDCGNYKHLWELCCRLDSTLTEESRRAGMTAHRKTIENGYNLEKDEVIIQLLDDQKKETPHRTWWSLKCTEWSNIQNINQRSAWQVESLRKKRQKARRCVRNALETIKAMLQRDPDLLFYWEWPKSAYAGWSLKEMRDFEKHMRDSRIRLHWVKLDGYMFGVKTPDGELLRKEWYIMTNDEYFASHASKTCDGSHQHREGGIIGIGSKAVEATGFYSVAMVTHILKVWKNCDEQLRRRHYNLKYQETIFALDEGKTEDAEMTMRGDVVDIPQEKRDQALAQLHRLHKAAGHPANRALARLCKDRHAPLDG